MTKAALSKMMSFNRDGSVKNAYLFRTRDSSGISTLVSTSIEANIDISKEKRSQRFLGLIVAVYFLSLLPLNVLK